MIERGTLKGRPRERCQKESCHRIRKLEKAVLEAEVKRPRLIELDFNVQVAGHVRAADVLWQPTQWAKEAAEKTAADLLKNNKKHLESAKKLRAERGVLLDEIATLTGKLHAATFELEGLARTERHTARMRAGAEKGLLGAVEKAEEKAEDAECMAVLRVAAGGGADGGGCSPKGAGCEGEGESCTR